MRSEAVKRRRREGPVRSPRDRAGSEESSTAAGALVAVIARALGLQRAALLLEGSPGGDLIAVATHRVEGLPPVPPGTPPGLGPWSLSLPVRAGARVTGLLLLDRGGATALPGADRLLAASLAEAAAGFVEHPRVAADLERTRELLAQADRLSALGTLAASVAHEIRNPLVSVRTFIQLLPERLADEEFRTGFRDLALGEIERICGLINDLLVFSRPAPAQREPTDLNELVRQIVRLLDAEARRREVDVHCRGDASLPLVVVDEAQVKQVLMNVLLNAIQACDPRGRVEITSYRSETATQRWCILAVADSGSGIAPEHAEQIFDPFFTTKDGGSGLGLFIARQIVTGHGGYIGVAPSARGGTEFSLHFPVRARANGDDDGG